MRHDVARALLPGAALGAILSLAACGQSESTVIRLVTSRPEFAGYAELFNQARPEYKLELVYAEDPLETLDAPRPGDIVVSDRLTCRESLSRLDGLDDLFRRGGLRRDGFYPGSLEMGVADGRQRAVPVSFSMPALAYKDGAGGGLQPGVLLEIEDLRRLGAEFNHSDNGRSTRIGFSPLWDPTFLVTAAVLGPPSYEGTQDCRLTWRNRELTAAIEDLRAWVADTNGGMPAQQEFTERYLYEPYAELLRRDRILFYSLPSGDLFDPIPPEGLGYRWLAVNGRIPVLTDVLSVGIPRGAAHKAAARAFLRWFLSTEGQQTILAAAAAGQTEDTFGVAGGFSTLAAVNERALVRRYPTLIGHIPSPEYLLFPEPLPVDWPEMSEALLRPWLESSLRRPNAAGASLAQELTQTLREGMDQLRRDRR